MKNNKSLIIGIIFCVILLLSLFSNYLLINKVNNMDNKFNRYENTIKALNDTLTVKINGQTAIWTKLTPEINLDELINSEYFNSLSAEQQKYYKDLKNIKGLIASTQTQLEKQGKILETLKVQYSNLTKDTISFKRGHELTWSEKDTTKKLQWNSKVTLDSITTFDFDYKYNVDITTNFVRNKDKSIKVEYILNDPDLKLNYNNSFIIPQEQRTKWQKFWDKNGKWLRPVGAAVIFGAGTYVGTQIK